MDGKIFGAIVDVMKEIGAVGKDGKSQQGYKYRGIDAVMNALNPALINNGVFVVPEVLEQAREERTNTKGTTLIYSIVKMKFTFYASDGSSVSAVVVGEGMDSGDKATNKAMSIAFKYACFQTFCIPTEELLDDADKENHKIAPAPPKSDGTELLIRLEELCNSRGITANDMATANGLSSIDAATIPQIEAMIRTLEMKGKK